MNKTTDGRFIDKRVVIDSNSLKKIINDVKKENNLSWKGLGNKLGVSSQTAYVGWVNKGQTIPLSVFKKLIKLSNSKFDDYKDKIKIVEPFWGQKLNKQEKKVKIPNVKSKEFAEFYGIMLGDGCVNSNLKGFSISGDKFLEKKYYEEHVSNLIHKLFGYRPSTYISKKTRDTKLVFYSKNVCNFLANQGFPVGLKSNGNIKFPHTIKNDRKNLALCLRGMMDTDGSLSAHPNVKIMIHLSITHPQLRKEVSDGLLKFGIKGGLFNKGIMIYGKDKIKMFNDEVGFSNHKHLLKYKIFLKKGKVPSSKEIEMFLRQNHRFNVLAL